MHGVLADGATFLLASSWADAGPELRLVGPGDDCSRVVPLIGLRLNYRATLGRRRCLGHRPFRPRERGYQDCAEEPQPGSRKCERCNIIDATFASNLHHAHLRGPGELDPDILAQLHQPNLLYVAGFRDGSVKVGTTASGRVHRRLAEQGAWRAVVIASSTDGFAVRSAEDRVSSELGLGQSVAIGRKLDGMIRPRPDADLDAELERWAEPARDLVASMGDERLAPLDERWVFPDAGAPVWGRLHRYPLPLDTGSHDLEVLAACGRLIALRRPASPDDVFVADIGQLFGVEIDVGDYESDELAVQDALF